MDLRLRAVKLAAPQSPVVLPPVSAATWRIIEAERRRATRRNLRAVMCLHALFACILATLSVENYALNVFVHVVMLVNSLIAEVYLFFIYRVEAGFAGITNSAALRDSTGTRAADVTITSADNMNNISTNNGATTVVPAPVKPPARSVNVLHSPYVNPMLLEMVIWIVQAPPGLRSRAWSNALDGVVFLRVYVALIAFHLWAERGAFRRAVELICGCPTRALGLLRSNLLFAHAPVSVGCIGVFWLLLSAMYGRSENVPFGDATYFVFTTAAFVGYGDIEPVTGPGRFVAVLAWLLGLFVLAWCIGVIYAGLALSAAEENMYTLFTVNQLCARVPAEAARTVQRAWKLYKAKKERRNWFSRQFNALLLSQQVIAFRALRRRFTRAEQTYLRSSDLARSTKDLASSTVSVSPASLSPASTPRSPGSRRPFALYQPVRVKPSSQATTPRHASDMFAGRPVTTLPVSPVRAPAAPQPPPARADTAKKEGEATTPRLQIRLPLEERLARLEHTLDELLQSVGQLVPAQAAAATAVTEVDS